MNLCHASSWTVRKLTQDQDRARFLRPFSLHVWTQQGIDNRKEWYFPCFVRGCYCVVLWLGNNISIVPKSNLSSCWIPKKVVSTSLPCFFFIRAFLIFAPYHTFRGRARLQITSRPRTSIYESVFAHSSGLRRANRILPLLPFHFPLSPYPLISRLQILLRSSATQPTKVPFALHLDDFDPLHFPRVYMLASPDQTCKSE